MTLSPSVEVPVAESPSVVTELLQAWTAGDQSALERLLPLVYAELRRVAQNQMRHETPGLTLHRSRCGWRTRSAAIWSSRSASTARALGHEPAVRWR